MRLIDADAFENYVFDEWNLNEISNSDWITFREWLKDQETIVEFDDEITRVVVRGVEYKPSAQPDRYVKIPETGIDDLSDGFHTFKQLYYQRMMLFATIVKQNKNKAWKSLRHEDGELCFGGGWFIVGVDTPEGSYTYHYENKYFDLFDCEILDYGKHWDGHTEKDVIRLLSLPSEQQETMYYPQIDGITPSVIVQSSTQPEIIRCKDCKHRPLDGEDTQGFGVEFPDYKCPCQCEDGWYNWRPDNDWFCANAERRTNEID